VGRRERSIAGSKTVAASRSPPLPSPGNWPCCAGIWSPRDEDYAFGRPSLTAHKRPKLELAAGVTSRRGPVAGPSHDYFIKQLRDQEKELVAQAERAYEVVVAHWQPKRPATA
jgi:hypothetical protein